MFRDNVFDKNHGATTAGEIICYQRSAVGVTGKMYSFSSIHSTEKFFIAHKSEFV